MKSMKMGITLDDALVERMDKYCGDNYLSRSGLISLSVASYLNAAEASRAVVDMALIMRKIAEQGSVDSATLEKLEDIQRLAKMLCRTE